MYRPRAFAVDEVERCLDLARTHPFATVVAPSPDGVPPGARIGHVPAIATRDVVAFHVALANPLASLVDGDTVVVVFHGPHAMVSASWYAEPTDHVPTWDHEAVHATGRVRVLDDDEFLAHLRDLTATFEGPDGWDLDAARGEVDRLLPAARGFEVQVDAWEGVAKLSQNRSPEDRHAVGSQLLRSSDEASRRTGERVLAEAEATRIRPPATGEPRLADFELRLPTTADRDAFLAAVQRSGELLSGWAAPPATPAAFDDWLARIDPTTNRRQLAFHRGELIGMVNLQNVVYGQGLFATLGYLAFGGGEGRGLMRRAVALGIDVAFGDMGLHRVEAGIQPANVRSLRLVKALGFRREGLLRRLVRVDGEFRDHELWATDTEDWPGAAALFPG